MFDRAWRTGPLPVDATPAFIHEKVGIAGSRMQLAHVVGDQDAVGVVPGTRADAITCVDRLVPVSRVTFDTEISAPAAVALAGGGSKPLTGCISALQATEIARRTGHAGHEEAQCRSRRTGRRVIATAGGEEDGNYKHETSHGCAFLVDCADGEAQRRDTTGSLRR